MERINFDNLTPIKFKRNPFEFLKAKILTLNPGATINWDDFKMAISRPENIGAQGTITLSLKEEAKPNYINPHRTVVFKYTCDISIADILRDHYHIPEVVNLEDLKKLSDYIEGSNHNRTGYFGPPLLPGSFCRMSEAYKTAEGSHTDQSFSSTLEPLEVDVNASILVCAIYGPSGGITSADTNNPGYFLALLPYASTTAERLTILGKSENVATQDFNINGGEFSIDTLGISLSEIIDTSEGPAEGTSEPTGSNGLPV